jgi:hypothetical protein
MKRYNINQLRSTLQLHFHWNYYRILFLTRFVSSVILAATVNLTRISLMMNTKAKDKSNYRGLQRFFSDFKMDYREHMKFVLKMLPEKQKFYLVMDRTNWKFGLRPINMLMLGIIYKKHCFPFCWEFLDKEGSSSTEERKALLGKAISILGKDRVLGLFCDREFIGIRWFKYLIDQQIEFHIRVPKQLKLGSILAKNRKTINWLFRYWKDNVKVDYPKQVEIFGYKVWVSAMKSDKGYCVVVSNRDNINSLEKYQLRWTIESMFGAFKSRGFKFEDTHMKDLGKIKKLIALVSIAYIWCILVGLWISESIKIRIATHGRREKSIFRVGFDFLTTFIKKLLTGNIYNPFEFNQVISLLSCT